VGPSCKDARWFPALGKPTHSPVRRARRTTALFRSTVPAGDESLAEFSASPGPSGSIRSFIGARIANEPGILFGEMTIRSGQPQERASDHLQVRARVFMRMSARSCRSRPVADLSTSSEPRRSDLGWAVSSVTPRPRMPRAEGLGQVATSAPRGGLRRRHALAL
jgi:hypothetical protein